MPFTPPPPLKAGIFGSRGPKAKAAPTTTAVPLPPPPRPKGVNIEHRIGVQAPAEVIWEVIADLPGWERWNPMYPKAAGEIRMGGVLDLTVHLDGQPPQQIKPVVLEWVPNEQLHWRLTLMNGFVKTTRYIEIESLAEAGCIVSNGEIFGGLMGRSAVRPIGRAVRRGFEAMNEALKAEAEARYKARG